MKSDIGNFYDFITDFFQNQPRELSYLNDSWSDLDKWKVTAREKVLDSLSHFPPRTHLQPKTISSKENENHIQEEVEFNTSALTRVSGTVLKPKTGKKVYPAIVALHDHGGFYYFGREKIISSSSEPDVLKEFKKLYYGNRSWANELVQRGYIVLVIDAFYFGKRKLDYSAVSDEIKERFKNPLEELSEGSNEYIEAFNMMCRQYEGLLVRHIFTAGSTWAGILSHDDRLSVEYLLSRDDVDSTRIGCSGLSIGGYRAALLAGTDPRISCAVITGWMPSLQSLLHSRLRDHTFMVFIPGLLGRHMEFSDIVSIMAPNPLFVQQCRLDDLYTETGMRDACDSLEKVYIKADRPNNFKSKFYECTHKFNVEMQDDALDWLDQHLQLGEL